MATLSGIKIHVEDTDKGDDKKDRLINLCRSPPTKESELNRLLQHNKSHDITTLLDIKNKEGTTALHEACCYGNTTCIKAILKHGGCATIWDVRGFTPLHCAAYNGHLEAVEILLGWMLPPDDHNRPLTPDTLSEFEETALHIACMRGHLKIAKYLRQQVQKAQLDKVDKHSNTVFHYAASSNDGRLLIWLVNQFGGSGSEEMKTFMSKRNKFGQTPAHRAATLGCVMSMSVLVQYGNEADFKTEDNAGHTPIDLARLFGNHLCHSIANGTKEPLPLPRTPPTQRGSLSQSMDSLNRRGSLLQPQRSISNGDSATSVSPTLKRRNSTTRSKRPVNFGVPLGRNASYQNFQSSQGSRGSISSRLSGDNISRSSIDLENLNYVTVRKDSMKKMSFKRQDSTWEETKELVSDSTIYEPPLDISFIPPIEKKSFTKEDCRMFSTSHDIKLRVSTDYWTKNNLKDDHKLETCVCAAMHLNQSYPQGYVIVSPICFVSCKCRCPCEISLSLPHAVRESDASKLCVLSTSMSSSRKSVESPLFSPSERMLVQLEDKALSGLERKGTCVNFRISIQYPCLFALAVDVREEGESVPRPLVPLRCVLYVRFPVLDRTRSVSRVYITSYVGLALKTVATDMASRMESKSEHESEEEMVNKSFLLSESVAQVSGSLINNHDSWELSAMGEEEFKYNQIALTQDPGSDSYSHQQEYPPHQKFFLEPKNPTRAVKCKLAVADTKRELASVLVIPYSPVKEPTPEPSPLSSQPSSQHSSLTTLLIPHANGHESYV